MYVLPSPRSLLVWARLMRPVTPLLLSQRARMAQARAGKDQKRAFLAQQADLPLENKSDLRAPPTQSCGEPERVAGSPKDQDVSGCPMPSLPKATRRAGRSSRPGTWGKHNVSFPGPVMASFFEPLRNPEKWAVVGNTAHKCQK